MSQPVLTESSEKTKQRVEQRQSTPDSARSFTGQSNPILNLQRTLGNQRVAQLIKAKRLTPDGKVIGLQPKLTVGAADDQYEQEADRIARQVVSMPDPAVTQPVQQASQPQIEGETDKAPVLQSKPLPLAASITPFVQRKTEPSEVKVEEDKEDEKDELLQEKFFDKSATLPFQRLTAEEEKPETALAKSPKSLRDSFEAGDVVESRLNQSKGQGSPLPDQVRSYMEPRFGVDFSHVRIHTGSESIKMTRDVGAQAFTNGSDIYYGAGSRPTNLELTAHELTHVVQQTGGAPLQTKRLDETSSVNTHLPLQRPYVIGAASSREEGGSDPDSSTDSSDGQGNVLHRKAEMAPFVEQDNTIRHIQRAPAAKGNLPVSSEIVDISTGVFNPSEKVKAEIEARPVIAHKLANVLQQRSTNEPCIMRRPANQPAPTMGTTPQSRPQPGTVEDRREFALLAVRFLEMQGEFFALHPDRDVAQVLGHLKTTAHNALTTIANDAGSNSIADRVRAAYSAAVRTVLSSRTAAPPNAGQTPPTLQQLYERHRDDILPFALPQAQADTGAAELSAELSAQLPRGATQTQRARHRAIQLARQRLRVITAQVDTPIADLFSTQGGTTTIRLPANTTARLSSTIPATLHRGLQSLAAQLMDTPLEANTTLTLALDLTSFGGSYDAYRFTRLDLGTLGTEILIERQGRIGIEGLWGEQRTALQERFNRVGFRASGFSRDEFDQVLIGLGEIPEAQLSLLRGLRLERAPSDPQRVDAAAHYDQLAHTVRVFDRAYTASMTRLGRAGRTLQFAAHAVAHEVGHALDLSSLRTTAAATSAAQEALLAEFGTGGSDFDIPHVQDPRRARFNELQAGVTGATAAERRARSRSGARWTTGNPQEVIDQLAAGAGQPAFRQAVLRDGGGTLRMPTDYPNPESVWQEYFADSFSLYQTSPDLLRRIRPNVYDFMAQEFPR